MEREVELGGEAHRAQHAQRVVTKHLDPGLGLGFWLGLGLGLDEREVASPAAHGARVVIAVKGEARRARVSHRIRPQGLTLTLILTLTTDPDH